MQSAQTGGQRRMSDRTAVLAVHGISPQLRYGFQDAFAAALLKRLNRLKSGTWGFEPPSNSSGPWKTLVQLPSVEQNSPVDDIPPSFVRIHKSPDNHVTPPEPIIDVYEGYWSPIDKNKTKAFSVVNWMLHNLFVPANTAARVYAGFWKAAFDWCYLIFILLLIPALTYFIVNLGTQAYLHYANIQVSTQSQPFKDQMSVLGVLYVVIHPGELIATLPARVAISVALSVAAAFLAVQGLVALVALVRQWSHDWRDPVQGLTRLAWSLGSLVVGILLLLYASNFQLIEGGSTVGPTAWLLGGCVLAFRAILSISQDVLVNYFGDVQIYCSHDENSRFFVLRQSILRTVEATLASILRKTTDGKVDGKPFYDRVIVVAHSLGSTIAMDALMNLHNLVKEGGFTQDQWRRIRAFVTLGSALEKTKYFFDAQAKTLSESYEQWRPDAYGPLFADRFAVLAGENSASNPVCYWSNYWYFADVVANEIKSYTATVAPQIHGRRSVKEWIRELFESFNKPPGNPKLICQNVRLRSHFIFPFHVWVHSDYVEDDSFWRSRENTEQHDQREHGLLEILLEN